MEKNAVSKDSASYIIIFFLKVSEKYINVNYKNKYLPQFKRISTFSMKRETWAFK